MQEFIAYVMGMVLRFFATLIVLIAVAVPAAAEDFGKLEGEFVAKWLPDGRSMELLEPVSYTAPDGSRWEAPKGLITDGASIPSPLWSVIGSPFAGKYRSAAVVHDHYCETKSRPWRDVHKAFYTASRAAGVEATKAWIMYFAVYRFGPRWVKSRSGDSSVIVFKPRFVRSEFEEMKARIERGELDLKGIEKASDRSLRSLSRSIID